tara:strand:- start:25 stop:1170 length:1146 start_codon:yes stop_codon:yes gene_type:complete
MSSSGFPPRQSEFSLESSISVPQWKASSGLSDYDGLCMHSAIYPGLHTEVRGEIINEPIQYFANLIEAELVSYLEGVDDGDTLRVVDYGSGTGLVIHELLKLLEGSEPGKQILAKNINLEIYAVDLPNAWFLVGKDLLQHEGRVKFYSLLDESTQKIRQLDQIFPEHSIDIIFSSMVFHLIPEKAMPALFQACRRILRPGGRLLWNSPDLVEDSPLGFKMHTPYRILRETITRLLTQPSSLQELWKQLIEVPAYKLRYLRNYLPGYCDNFDHERLPELDADADAYIKPDNRVPPPEKLHSYLQEVFVGRWENRYFDVGEDSLYPAILIPANEGYINQLPPGLLRTWLIEVLLHTQVLPELRGQSTDYSLKIGWTFGVYERG